MSIHDWLNRLGQAGIIGTLLLTGCGDAAENSGKETELTQVYRVEKVTMKRLAKTPPALVLDVEGTARTAGWENISLEPMMIENDTLTYQLMGKPPEGVAAQVLSPVRASRIVDPLPEGTTKIRVKAADNEVIEEVPPAPEE